jgi:hypothetical protein
MTEPYRPRLIGLYAPAAGSGKTTLAMYLMEHGYYTVSFAAPLKLMTIQFLQRLGYSSDDANRLVYEDKHEVLPEIGVNTRHLLRTLGTEWGRDCVHPEVWLTCWERAANQLLSAETPVICDDVRFPNEAALIRKLGGEMWHLSRPNTERGTTHASEGSLDNYPYFDRHIVNDGTVFDLYARVKRVIQPTVHLNAA